MWHWLEGYGMALSADSVIEAIPAAFRRMTRTLFEPFDLGKWFVMGFCAWLASLGDGGVSPSLNFNIRGSPLQADFPDLREWLSEYWPVIALVAILLFLAGLAFTLLILWLSSRGKFMFLDGVVYNRGAVVDPWHRYRQPANSLFGFRVLYGLAILLALALVAAACLGLAWVDIARGSFGPAALAAILIGGASLLAIILAAGIISSLVDDFVVPVMYLRGQRVMAAWGIVWRELVQGHLGLVLLFYVVKILLAIAIAAIALAAMCLTCCLAALPYLGTVILLPLFVFVRCYSLCFIEQYGPEWRVFAYEMIPSLPPIAEE